MRWCQWWHQALLQACEVHVNTAQWLSLLNHSVAHADKAVETTVDTAVLVVERLLPDSVAALQQLPVTLINAAVLNSHVDALAVSLGLTAIA